MSWEKGLSQLAVELKQDEAQLMRPERRARLVTRAVQLGLQHPAEKSADRAVSRRPMWAALAAVLAALAIMLAFQFVPSSRSGAQPTLLAGELRAGDESLQMGNSIPPSVRLTARRPSELQLGSHAAVRADLQTELTWHAQDRTLTLHAGRVHCSVDPSLRLSFRVESPHFSVLVLGTEFAVDLDSVRVASGRVRVTPVAGASFELAAGQSWSRHELAQRAAEATGTFAHRDVAAPAGSGSGPAAASQPVAGSSANPAPARASAQKPAPTVESTAAMLGRARADLASGQVARAVDVLNRVLREGSPNERLEAELLLADAARLKGQRELAMQRYLGVSERAPGSRSAESALFTAAVVALEAGDSARARSLFRAYLQRYPRGEFSQRARARLGAEHEAER
jgi:TolA-binding protein